MTFPAFKQEQRKKFWDVKPETIEGYEQFIDSLIDSTAQYVLENCLPEERDTLYGALSYEKGFTACRQAFLAKARELGIKE